MGQLLTSQEKERENWLFSKLFVVGQRFPTDTLNTPSIILLSVEYLLRLLAFQVVEFGKFYLPENSLFVMVS